MGAFAAFLSALGVLKPFLNGALSFANSLVGYLDRKADRDVDLYKTKTGAVVNLTGQALQVQAARESAQDNLALTAMTHPIWWVMWGMWVLPPALYDAMIYFVSMFDAWLNTPGCIVWEINEPLKHGAKICEWYVRKIPSAQAEARLKIIVWIFGAQAVAGAAGGVVSLAKAWLAKDPK
jgi:hypothetical protein